MGHFVSSLVLSGFAAPSIHPDFLALALGRAAQTAHVRHVLAKRGGKVDLMVLLLDEDLADLLRQGELTERFALPDPLLVIDDGLILVIEIELQHVSRLLRDLHRLRRDARHLTEIVDLPRDGQRML